MTFEEALERLQEVVRRLEDGQLGLNESLEQYEQGVGYLKFCHASLEQAERRIELIVGMDRDGEVLAEPFDESPSGGEQADERGAGRRRRSAPRPRSARDGDVDASGSLF